MADVSLGTMYRSAPTDGAHRAMSSTVGTGGVEMNGETKDEEKNPAAGAGEAWGGNSPGREGDEDAEEKVDEKKEDEEKKEVVFRLDPKRTEFSADELPQEVTKVVVVCNRSMTLTLPDRWPPSLELIVLS